MKFFLPLCLMFFTVMLSSCAEHPGDPQTTDMQQFIGDGFAFKYPSSARLDLQGENEWANRTLTVSGGDVTLFDADGNAFTLPAFRFTVEVFDNPAGKDARAFARQKISGGYESALQNEEPTGMWPVDPESGEVLGRHVRVRGHEAFEARFFAGDSYMVRTFTGNSEKIIAVGFHDMPPENNPMHEAWEAAWIYALDSVRLH